MAGDAPAWDSVEEVVPPLEVTDRHFAIVLTKGERFEVGIADGIWPWKHCATCETADDANRICTLLAMHYRIRSMPMSPATDSGTDAGDAK